MLFFRSEREAKGGFKEEAEDKASPGSSEISTEDDGKIKTDNSSYLTLLKLYYFQRMTCVVLSAGSATTPTRRTWAR